MKRKTLLQIGAALLLATASVQADLREGLVSYWPLDTLDFAPPWVWPYVSHDMAYTNHLNLENIIDNSHQVTGKFGKAVNFAPGANPGAEPYLHLTTPAGEDNGLPISRNAAWTVALWVRGNALDATYNNADRRVYADSSSLISNPLMTLGTRAGTTNTSSRIYFRNAGAPLIQLEHSTNSAAVAFDGSWRHLALVAKPGQITYYVDGVLDLTNSYVRGTEDVDTTTLGAILRLANTPPAATFFQGAIDDVAVWSRPLSQAEVQEVMTNSIQTPIPSFAPGISAEPVGSTNLFPGRNWTLLAGVTGTRPMTYQWIKNGADLTGQTNTTLALTNLALTDSGDYAFVVQNAQGRKTSAVAQVTVNPWPAPNLTNGIIAYWPLNAIVGTKTPDLVSGYDMNLYNMTAANVVAGRYDKAFSFSAATPATGLSRVNNPGEDLPIYNKPTFTISMWVNGLTQNDRRVFSEGSTGNNTPLFNIGTHNTAADATVDSYIRSDTSSSANHQHGTLSTFDGDWHHIVYVQRTVGTTVTAEMYVDGVKDTIVPSPRYPMTVNTTSIGAILRGGYSAHFTGLIDEVAIWGRELNPPEIVLLQSTTITNPPSRLQPLAINTLRPDFPAVVEGQTIVLRWDVSKDAAQVLINQGVGDVTASTVAGAGSKAVTLNDTTTFVMTVSRGLDSISATTTVAVVKGVAPGWVLLDNFDTYTPGLLADAGDWFVDVRGRQIVIENINGNRLMNPAGVASADSAALLRLQTHKLLENQAGTLFFRLIPRGNPATNLREVVGLTDKPVRWIADVTGTGGLGPTVSASVETAEWHFGAVNDVGGAVVNDPNPLATGAVYSVWIDITNVALTEFPYNDVYTVYVQKDGDATRTMLFSGPLLSNRDQYYVDAVLPLMATQLDFLVVGCNNATDSALLDDFYLSHGAYNATVPKAFTVALPPGPLSVAWVGSQLEIRWTNGTLQQADAVTGTWADVPGNPTSPHRVTPSGTKYYRSRQ